jgi:hypothetical protein
MPGLKVPEVMGWKQATGALQRRGLMLERAGQSSCYPLCPHIWGQRRTARLRPESDSDRDYAAGDAAGSVGSIEIQLVRRTAAKPLFIA